jgi:TATA-box binding protein (TBP) (component of TFIID and TFIIIB)
MRIEKEKKGSLNVVFVGEDLPSVTITNVCSFFDSGAKIDFDRLPLMRDLPCYYNPTEIPNLKIMISTDRIKGVKCLIYENGKVILPKAAHELAAQQTALKAAQLLNKFNIKAQVNNFSITNIAGRFSLGYSVNISKAEEKGQTRSKSSENFPALSIQPKLEGMNNPTINVFESGNGVITGVQQREQVVEAMKWFYTWIKDCKATPEQSSLILPRFATYGHSS